MSIKEIMKIGTDGMSRKEIQDEKERRIQVSERINLIQWRCLECEKESKKAEKGSKADKTLKAKIRSYQRELNRIKGAEREWLREAAWFLYA